MRLMLLEDTVVLVLVAGMMKENKLLINFLWKWMGLRQMRV
jgi:hypothetical protein